MKNCFNLIQPFAEIAARDNLPILAMGSMAIIPFTHEQSTIQSPVQVDVPGDIDLPNFRSPDAKKPRDFDFLVVSSDKAYKQAIQDKAQLLINPKDTDNQGAPDDLEIEAFAINTEASFQNELEHPLAPRTIINGGTSDRYEVTATDGEHLIYKMAAPFGTPLPEAALKPCTINIGDRYSYQAMPFGTILGDYLTRSCASLRKRNVSKVDQAVTQVLQKSPETREWIMDGPGAKQLELAGIYLALRRAWHSRRPLILGDADSQAHLEVRPADHHKLAEHPMFLLKDAEPTVQRTALAIARLRALATARVEDSTAATDFWLEHIMPHLRRSIHHT